MNGYSHFLSGVLAGAGLALVMHLNLEQAVASGVVLGGTVMVPDLDHPDAIPAHTFGVVTQDLSWVVSHLSGGHRGGTHSFAGVLLAYEFAWGATHFGGKWGVLALVGFAAALGCRGLLGRPAPHRQWKEYVVTLYLAGLGTAAAGPVLLQRPNLVPILYGLGSLLHILGDLLNHAGCPLWWPLGGRQRLPLLGESGGWAETRIAVPVMAVGTVALYGLVAWPA